MSNKFFLGLVVFVATTVFGAEWRPPVGIPHPPFGITNSVWMYTNSNFTWNYGNGAEPYRRNQFGPYTHFIDNTHPNSTDSGNPFGTPEKPRKTWPYPVPEGSAIQLSGSGTYSFSNGQDSQMAVGGTGTGQRPIFFYGTTTNRSSMPKISREFFCIWGDWLIVEKIRFIDDTMVSTRPIHKRAPVKYTCVRDCYFGGTGVADNPRCISTGGSGGNTAEYYTENLIILRNEMHNYGDREASAENDACGMIISQFATNVWVLENEVYDMGGDSIRIGADEGDAVSGGYYYIGNNRFYDNRENAIDVKQARNAVISGNVMWGFRESSSSSGTCLTVHYVPENIWILNNTIFDSTRGIVSTGVKDLYVIGNTVYDCYEYAMYLTRGGGTFYVANNSIASSYHGIYTSGTVDALHYRNNIISDMDPSGYHLYLASSGISAASTASSFVFHQPSGQPRIRWGGDTFSSTSEWTSRTGKGQGSMVADPKFVNASAKNFRLSTGSPAIDAGVSIADYDNIFRSRFGHSIMTDVDLNPRPSGNAMDIGADEVSTGGPTRPAAPQNVRIVVD